MTLFRPGCNRSFVAQDYLQALKAFSEGGGTDINQFLKQHTEPVQTTPGPTVQPAIAAASPAPAAPVAAAPPPPAVSSPANALGSAPISPAPTGSDTVTPAPAAMAAMTPPPEPASAPIPAPPVIPSSAPQGEYLPNENVVRQANRVASVSPGFGGVSGAASGSAAATLPLARNPIPSRNLYPPEADQSRMLGTAGNRGATPTDRARFDKSFGFTPAPSAAAAPAAKKDAYDIGPYAEDSTGTFGSGWKPSTPAAPTASASPAATATASPRLAQAESDSPPGAQEWAQGPLANPKPTPPPKPAGQRLATAGINALPRSRNQNAFATTVPRIFAGA